MFVIDLVYKASLEESMRTGGAYAPSEEDYTAGNFLGSGREIPKSRVRAESSWRSANTARTSKPLPTKTPYTKGLANVRVIEFLASQKAKDIQKRIETS
jgi:hypothetical protein